VKVNSIARLIFALECLEEYVVWVGGIRALGLATSIFLSDNYIC
jgi:hypothetical protein